MEQKITKSLPDVIENSTDAELSDAFRMHLDETQGHVSSVEGLLRKHTGEAATETCKVIKGLLSEASDIITDVTDLQTFARCAWRSSAPRSRWSTTRLPCMELCGAGLRFSVFDEDAAVLESIEAEEENADAVLTEIADRVNLEATV